MRVTTESEAAARAAKKKPGEWKPAIVHAVLISLFVLGLFYYWFAVADRYTVFLYGHLGALPFDEMTSSRYWMAGLVASGAVLVVYSALNGVLGRVWAARGYSPPAWWRVWVLCVAPLVAGILVITTTFNQPTLPLLNATACATMTLIGLALALPSGAWAAQRPLDLVWLTLDGMGLMPVLLLLRAIELPGRGLVSVPVAYAVVVTSVVAGVVWLGAVTALRVWRRASSVGAMAVFVAGLCLSYLLMPLVHHLFFTPAGYRYITASTNFFARHSDVQLVALFVAASLAAGVTPLRRRLQLI